LGDFKVTTLLAGSRNVENPHQIFGTNVSGDDFNAAAEAAFIPSDVARFFFTPTIVNTGSDVILFDTGTDAGGLTWALNSAGYQTSDVTHVVLTHMHGDHIGGLTGDAGETFTYATYITGQLEYDHWDMSGNEGFEAKVRPLADRMQFLNGGDSVRPGITAVEAFGHTPGHMAYMIESGGKELLLMADVANHYVWSLQNPEWEVRFDADKAAAAQTRKTIFDMASTDRIPLIGYHMPFPGLGYVEKRGEGGYHFVPHSYQLM
jgi:glyoxylase-like metal-dependent hydrolase (beta-lactamase superfamily II)